MKRRRVKITGIGPVTPAGIGREAFWQGLLEPVSRIRPYKKIDEEFGPFIAGYVDKFDASKYVNRSLIPNGAARHTLFAVAGAALALQDAGIGLEAVRGQECVVYTGTSVMDFEGINRGEQSVFKRGLRGVQPRLVFSTHVASVATTIMEVLGLKGQALALQSSCCGGLDAIGFGAEQVATGEADLAICGGTEAPLFKHPLLELRGSGLTPPTTDRPHQQDRPFDLWRTTGVVSEGACLVVLEPENSPRRGYSFVRGYANAHDDSIGLCGGLERSIKLALANGGLHPRDIEVINAWGPGHRIIDAAEARVLQAVFGDELPQKAVVSIKGAIGNALAAAPAIQVGVAALAQRDGLLPPTVNFQDADPQCPLNLKAGPWTLAHDLTLVNSHGLSGMNSNLILERCT
ncbi:MAG TPA: beta-ketoacyl synthase N-terminal-like domain-containing protein [Opitutus sp.]|nr:beta-ketoacyl synthase N-terminal-like domain-containing protein [Opitutus sp.]